MIYELKERKNEIQNIKVEMDCSVFRKYKVSGNENGKRVERVLSEEEEGIGGIKEIPLKRNNSPEIYKDT